MKTWTLIDVSFIYLIGSDANRVILISQVLDGRVLVKLIVEGLNCADGISKPLQTAGWRWMETMSQYMQLKMEIER